MGPANKICCASPVPAAAPVVMVNVKETDSVHETADEGCGERSSATKEA